MASVCKDSKGWRIRFVDADDNRRTLRPGKIDKRQAETIGRYVDSLVASIASGQPIARQTSLWLSDIGDKLHIKLERAGLIESRKPPEKTAELSLADFLKDHVEHGRTSRGHQAAESTLQKWSYTQQFLNEVFPDKPLSGITREDAHQFRKWLDERRIHQKTSNRNGQPLTENAKRKHIANCKAFFNAAVRRGLVEKNPFANQVSVSQADRSRDRFVTLDETRKLICAAPDAQWRLMIALWRLAGLRKMEIFNLTWGDVQWNLGKLLVHASKTKHIEGCDMRFAPLRDIRPFLEEAFQYALPKGQRSLPADAPIVTRFNRTNFNLAKPFQKIILAAGLTPWGKLFQNLRASCETQWLKDGERADLVANWIGHSVQVQRSNYVQYTDEDVESFNQKPAFESGPQSGPEDAESEANRAVMADALNSANPAKTKATSENTGDLHVRRAPPRGLEPLTRRLTVACSTN